MRPSLSSRLQRLPFLTLLFIAAPALGQTQPAVPSFSADSSQTLHVIDFGVVREGSVVASSAFSVFNRALSPGGAAMQFDGVYQLGDVAELALNGTPFDAVAPGGSAPLSMSLNTSTPGSFSVSYVISFESVGLPDAETGSLAIAAFAEVLSRADFNSDGSVDAADYDYWAARYGMTGTTADGNGDGVVNAADYTLWRDRVSFQNAAVAVPLPAAFPLASLGLLGMMGLAERRR